LARRLCFSRRAEYLGVSKYLGSGQKRMVVPVLRWPTVPVTFSFSFKNPSSKAMAYCLPSRLISTSSRVDRALTTETPTPCRPPEK
jgi:hypothetical protein